MFFSKVVTKLFTDVDICIKERGSVRGRIQWNSEMKVKNRV
jgi:hypothetical protein